MDFQDNLLNFQMPPIVRSMIGAVGDSRASLLNSIRSVKHAGFDQDFTCALVSFEIVEGHGFKPGKFVGELRGENADLCLGHGEECDRQIAFRVFVNGDAKNINESH